MPKVSFEVTSVRRWRNSIKKIKNGKSESQVSRQVWKVEKKSFSQSILKKTDYKLFKLLCAQFVASQFASNRRPSPRRFMAVWSNQRRFLFAKCVWVSKGIRINRLRRPVLPLFVDVPGWNLQRLVSKWFTGFWFTVCILLASSSSVWFTGLHSVEPTRKTISKLFQIVRNWLGRAC